MGVRLQATGYNELNINKVPSREGQGVDLK